MIQILLVDDHPLLRIGLRETINLESDMQVKSEASDGIDAIKKVSEIEVDLVLLDMSMPGMQGKDVIHSLKKMKPQLPILVLSGFSDLKIIREAYDSGASGYVLKTSPTGHILKCIRHVSSGGHLFPPELLKELENSAMHPVIDAETLTKREQEVHALIVQGLNNGEIAEQLFVSHGTVRSHISHILNKYHLKNRSQLILYSLQNQH